jgi:hypothetical protein
MIDPMHVLSQPGVAMVVRTALGCSVIYISRRFYADPMSYFRGPARTVLDASWLRPVVRGLACFCLWGGCFIVATAIAVQIFGLHGDALATVLMSLAAIATWFLLPRDPAPDGKDSSNSGNRQGLG